MHLKPKKHLGQNFLLDNNISKKIIKLLNCKKTDSIIEIGPGMGALTILLATHCKFLYAVEIDNNLCDYLNNKTIPNLKVIHADILKLNPQYLKGIHYFVGNLPYNIASQIIIYLLKNLTNWKRMVFMVQSEMAERILSECGSKNYGRLGVICQTLAHTYSHHKISPNVFFPKPKVNSTIISLEKKNIDTMINQKTINLYFDFIRIAFSQRRKKIKNCFKNKYDSFDLGNLKELRAQDISIDEYIILFKKNFLLLVD